MSLRLLVARFYRRIQAEYRKRIGEAFTRHKETYTHGDAAQNRAAPAELAHQKRDAFTVQHLLVQATYRGGVLALQQHPLRLRPLRTTSRAPAEQTAQSLCQLGQWTLAFLCYTLYVLRHSVSAE